MKQYFLPLTLGLLVAPLSGMEAEFNGKQEQEQWFPEEAAQQAADHMLGGALSQFSTLGEKKAFLATLFKRLADGSHNYFNVESAKQLAKEVSEELTQTGTDTASYIFNNPRLPNDLLRHILSYLEPAERLNIFTWLLADIKKQTSDPKDIEASQKRYQRLRDWYNDTDKCMKFTEALVKTLQTVCTPEAILFGRTTPKDELVQEVKYLIKGGADARVPLMTESKNSILLKLIQRGRLELAEVLIRAGADVNVPDKWGKRCLHLAIFQRMESLVWLLLEHGADVEAKAARVNGGIPHEVLYFAIEIEDDWIVPVVKTLIERGATLEVSFCELPARVKNQKVLELLHKTLYQ